MSLPKTFSVRHMFFNMQNYVSGNRLKSLLKNNKNFVTPFAVIFYCFDQILIVYHDFGAWNKSHVGDINIKNKSQIELPMLFIRRNMLLAKMDVESVLAIESCRRIYCRSARKTPIRKDCSMYCISKKTQKIP